MAKEAIAEHCNFEVIDLDSDSTMTCKNLASFPLPIEGPIGALGFEEKPLICGGRNGSNFFEVTKRFQMIKIG